MEWIPASEYEPSGTPEIRAYREKLKITGDYEYGQIEIRGGDGESVFMTIGHMGPMSQYNNRLERIEILSHE